MRRSEKKQRRKLLSRVMAMAAAITLTAVSIGTAMPVQAANIAPTDNLTTTFNKYLVMDENANVPDVDFTFTITAGNAVSATSGSRVIYAGDDATRVTGFPVLKVDNAGTTNEVTTAFNPGDNTYTGKQDGDTVDLESGQKYAKQIVTVDFTNVDFNAPGIYRYIITENPKDQDGITNDTTTTRTLDVFVQYKNNSETDLEIADYVLYPGTKTDTTDENEDSKDDGFTNTYTTYDLTLEKQVTGNQGDRDKYFEFTVNITGAVAGTIYDVDLTDATWNGSPSNPTNLTVGSDGSISGTFYLKDDESLVIQGLTAGTNYTIAETTYASDGYETSYVIDSSTKVEALNTGSQNMGASDHKVTFTNNKEGNVPTGIILEIAPYIVLAAVVLAGLAVLFVTRRRRAR